MGHNSRRCESGEGGTPWDLLPKQDPLKNRKRKSDPKTTLCRKKISKCFPHTHPPLWQKVDHIHDHHHWHHGACSGIPQWGDNLFFPLFPCAGLWVVLTPSLRALIKKHVPNGSWQAAPIMGCSPSLHLPHASGNTNSSSPSTAACLATTRLLMTVGDTVSLTIKHLGPWDVTTSCMKKAFW